jgi:hypothetical protein
MSYCVYTLWLHILFIYVNLYNDGYQNVHIWTCIIIRTEFFLCSFPFFPFLTNRYCSPSVIRLISHLLDPASAIDI